MPKENLSLKFFFLIFLLVIPQTVLGKKRIVLFYIGSAANGKVVINGHTAAIDAVEEQIRKAHREKGGQDEDLEIEKKNINDFSYTSPAELLRMEEEYIHKIKTAPLAYTLQYEQMKKTRKEMDPLLFETNFNLEKLAEYLEGDQGHQLGHLREKAEVVIGAHWLIPLALAQLKYQNRIPDAKTGWIFTDYYENPLFPKISQSIDMTFLGALSLKENFKKAGVSQDQIWSSGIPISPKALEKIDTDAYKLQKGLTADPETITITLAGGSEGLGNFPVIVSKMREKLKGKKVQVVVICAKNEEHFKTLNQLQNQWNAEGDNQFKMKIERVVANEDMLNYVKASDLYLIKSGGLSPTEGAVIGKPMILLDVLGGHEKDNIDFYERVGIGLANHDPHEIGDQVLELFDGKAGEEKRKKMLEAQENFRSGRDFQGISTFALASDPPKKDLEKKLPRSDERKSLLQEVGLGERGEMKFLREGQVILEEGQKLLRQGQQVVAMKKLDEALDFFKKSLLVNPNDYAPYFMMAHVHNLRKDYAEALKSLNLSLQHDPNKGLEGQYYHRGMIHIKLNNELDAIDDLAKAAQMRGFAYNHHAKSILERTFAKMVQASPDKVFEKTLERAQSLKRKDQWDGAIFLYQKAVQLNPNHQDISAHKLLAEALVKKGERDLAMQTYQEAIKKTPDPQEQAKLLVSLARIYQEKGELEEAKRNITAAKQIFPQLENIDNLFKELEMTLEGEELDELAELKKEGSPPSVSRVISGWKKRLEQKMNLTQTPMHLNLLSSVENVQEKFCAITCQDNPIKGELFRNYLSFMGGVLGHKLKKYRQTPLSAKSGDGDKADSELLKSMLIGQICAVEAEIKRCRQNDKIIQELKEVIKDIRKNHFKVNCHFESVVEWERMKEEQENSRDKNWRDLALPTENLIEKISTQVMLNPNQISQNYYEKIVNGLMDLQQKYDGWLKTDRNRKSREKDQIIKNYFDKGQHRDQYLEVRSNPYYVNALFKAIKKNAKTLPAGHSERVYFEEMEKKALERAKKRAQFMQDLTRLEEMFQRNLTGTPYFDLFQLFAEDKKERIRQKQNKQKVLAEKNQMKDVQLLLLPANHYRGPREIDMRELYIKN